MLNFSNIPYHCHPLSPSVTLFTADFERGIRTGIRVVYLEPKFVDVFSIGPRQCIPRPRRWSSGKYQYNCNVSFHFILSLILFMLKLNCVSGCLQGKRWCQQVYKEADGPLSHLWRAHQAFLWEDRCFRPGWTS